MADIYIFYNKTLHVSSGTCICINFDLWIGKPLFEVIKYIIKNKSSIDFSGIYWYPDYTDREIYNTIINKKNELPHVNFITVGNPILSSSLSEFAFVFSPIFNITSSTHFIHTWRVSADCGYIDFDILYNITIDIDSISNYPAFIQVVAYISFQKGYITLNKTNDNISKFYFDNESEIVNLLIGRKWVRFANCVAILNFKKTELISFNKQYKSIDCSKRSINYNAINKLVNLENTYDVIIPTIGRGKYLNNTITDLTKQIFLPYKIVVIEQYFYEDDHQYDFLATTNFPFEVVYIRTSKIGACNARNVALQYVESKYVFLADDDISFSANLTKEVIYTLINSGADAICIGTHLPTQKASSPKLCGWEAFASGCSIVKSTFLKNIKFDERFEFGYGEDTDFGISLRKQGAIILYSSYNSVLHYKAPAGGFRYIEKKVWNGDIIMPRPSPTIMLGYYKTYTPNQLKAYKIFYWFKTLIKSSFPDKLLLPIRWSKSKHLAKKLLKS